MPRINFEDKLFVDPRYKKLCQLLGEVQANGWLVILWRLAQEYYRKGILKVPFKVYEFALFPKELIECEFVEKNEDGYYIKGSKRNFDWIKKKHDSASIGGRISARRKRNELGQLTQAHTKHMLSKNPSTVQASSSSSSSSRKEKEIYKEKEKKDHPFFERLITLYNIYPRKLGKKKGITNLLKQIKSEEDYIAFSRAVKYYAACCSAEKTELKYIMHFSTFSNNWMDYAELAEKKQKVLNFIDIKDDE